jgi:molybdopterin converting factor small subunit
MRINITYLSQLKKAAGVAQETITVENPCTVQELLSNSVCPRRTQLGEAIRSADGSFRDILLVFVGDRQVDLGAPCALGDGDEVTMMFPIAGG